MNNNFKTLYSSRQGIELNNWLKDNKQKLKNQRIFYIVSAKIDKGDVFKIGLSERGGNSASSRLYDYVFFYGTPSKEYEGRGVKLYLCLANTYNPDVQNSDAGVRRVETHMKRYFKDKIARGTERFSVSIDDLFKQLGELQIINDIEVGVRQTPRLKEANVGSNDAVDEIVSHKVSRRGIITFEVQFKNTRVYDTNQNSKMSRIPNKFLTYEEIIQLRHGKKLVDKYIDKNIW